MPTLSARVLSVNVAAPAQLGAEDEAAPGQGPWSSGIYKRPVTGPVWLGELNLEGDGQADLKTHGGPDRSVCVYPSEHYPYWIRELDLAGLPHPSFGENLTVGGLLEDEVCVGDTFRIGEAVVQVTQPRLPCWKLARRLQVKDMAVRVRGTGKTGWHMRTLQPGLLEAGQEMELVERHHGEWPLSRALEVIVNARRDRAAAAELAACPRLSAYQRRALGDPDSVPRRKETEEDID
ncbi:MAG: MOSC domain-containing protein [Candidatus Dormibacterales bacterium]